MNALALGVFGWSEAFEVASSRKSLATISQMFCSRETTIQSDLFSSFAEKHDLETVSRAV